MQDIRFISLCSSLNCWHTLESIPAALREITQWKQPITKRPSAKYWPSKVPPLFSPQYTTHKTSEDNPFITDNPYTSIYKHHSSHSLVCWLTLSQSSLWVGFQKPSILVLLIPTHLSLSDTQSCVLTTGQGSACHSWSSWIMQEKCVDPASLWSDAQCTHAVNPTTAELHSWI